MPQFSPKKFILVLSILVCHGMLFSQEKPDKPNIVLLLADDLGWQDVKCYDIDEPSPMETPHLG